MNLLLKRDQEEIKINILRIRKIMYSLSARLELTDEETESMAKYGSIDGITVILSGFKDRNKRTGEVTIDALLNGWHCQSEDVIRLRAIEGEIRNLCENFKAYIEASKNFTGDEIIEY
jgi:hypothetical protein